VRSAMHSSRSLCKQGSVTQRELLHQETIAGAMYYVIRSCRALIQYPGLVGVCLTLVSGQAQQIFFLGFSAAASAAGLAGCV
jgi:hypothetical protein